MIGRTFQTRLWRGILLALSLAAMPVAAQEIAPDDVLDVGPRAEAYTDAIWGQGLQSEIVYLRPSADFDAEAHSDGRRIRIAPPEAEEPIPVGSGTARFVLGVLLAVILGVVIYVFVVNAKGVGVSFRDTGDTRSRAGARRSEGQEDGRQDQPLEQFLAALSAMADKREALILLVSRALEWAADRHQLRLGRAQTARDVLRVLPVDWPHLPAMRGLVREAEIVHFGGRDISRERWEECITSARAIFARQDNGGGSGSGVVGGIGSGGGSGIGSGGNSGSRSRSGDTQGGAA